MDEQAIRVLFLQILQFVKKSSGLRLVITVDEFHPRFFVHDKEGADQGYHWCDTTAGSEQYQFLSGAYFLRKPEETCRTCTIKAVSFSHFIEKLSRKITIWHS